MTITIIYKGDGKYEDMFDTYTAERTFRKVTEITMSDNVITMRFENPDAPLLDTPTITENLDIVESFVIK